MYFDCWTGIDGKGLCCEGGDRQATELYAADRWHVHARCTAEHVVHRVVTALVALGWGPEIVEDRDVISGGRSFAVEVRRASAPRFPSRC